MKLLLKNLIFTLLIPGTVGVFIPFLIMHDRHTIHSPILISIGLVLLVCGMCIYLWTVWDFATTGKGTPIPLDAPKRLVVRGLYRYVRNPMYLGVIIVILGWACVFSTTILLLYCLGVWIAVHIFVVLYEEPKLKQRFGTEYATYFMSVDRWVPHRHREL